jgi:hypothetical protein
MIKRFDLIRDQDETGISGTGRVATGYVVGPWAFMRWLTPHWTVTWYPHWEWIDTLHGHGGKTRMVFKEYP